MDKVLYISTAGANLAMKAQQVHANNLANVSTPDSAVTLSAVCP